MTRFHLVSTHIVSGKVHRWESGDFETREAAVAEWLPRVANAPFMALMDVATDEQWVCLQRTGKPWFEKGNAKQ